MVSVLTAQMGIFIHPKSFRVNQIVFVAAGEAVSPDRAGLQTPGTPSSLTGRRNTVARLENNCDSSPAISPSESQTVTSASRKWRVRYN
jgi:Tfp pilus assembly protein PilV